MGTRESGRVTPGMILGIFVLLLGVLLTLDNFGLIDSARYLRYWPVALIAIGLARLQARSGRFGGVVLVLLGGLLLAYELDLLEFSIWEFWPLLLVLLGIHLIARGVQRRRLPEGKTDLSSRIDGFALLSGFERRSGARDFQGGELTAILGGCDLDLRSASIPEGREAVLETFALMGGIDLRVPEDWTVVPKVTSVLGGFEDTTRPTPSGSPKRLVVKGMSILGGIKVQN